MTWTLRRVAAVSLLAILGLVLTAPSVEAAEPRREPAVTQTLAKVAAWNALAAHLLAWLGLDTDPAPERHRITAASGSGMDPNGGPGTSAPGSTGANNTKLGGADSLGLDG